LRVDRSIQTDARAKPVRPDDGTVSGASAGPSCSAARIRRLSLPRPRTGAALALTALVGVSTLVRLWGALRVPSPWFTPDEIVYGELGRSLYERGSLSILGHSTPFFSLVYPALVGPFLS